VGKRIADLGLPKGVIIGAIVKNAEVIIPNGNTRIEAFDRLIIFCLVTHIKVLKMFLG
jgi:trk system potassium uptake protein TrkA